MTYVPIGIMSYDEIEHYTDIVKKNPLTIEQIATTQSRICRYGGRGWRPYYDAQHAYLVSMMVPPKDALAGLLHDIGEVDTGDMIGPFKRAIKNKKLESVEATLMALRLADFGVMMPLPESVEKADKEICKYEMAALNKPGSKIEIPGVGKYEIWESELAEQYFLAQYYWLIEDM